METLRPNVNNVSKYPNKETLELFLKLGRKTGIFSNGKDSKGIDGYDNVNAVITLAVVCDYLCQEGKEKEKKSFLEELEKQGDMYYKTMGELALKIREEKGDLTPFSQSMINSNRKRLEMENRTHPYFPVITTSYFSERIQDINYQHMIHKDFESELDRLNNIQEGADKIQGDIDNHPPFYKGNNSNTIKDLKDKLYY